MKKPLLFLPSLFFLLLGTTLSFLGGCAGGNSNPTPATSASAPGDVTASAAPAQTETTSPETKGDVLRIGDTLSIRLTGVPVDDQQQFEENVNDRGEIAMPLLGNFVASGKTISDLAAEIIESYRTRKIYNNPSVLIVNLQRFVNVGGEVRNPQRITYTQDLTALKAISACGSFTDYADRKSIKILRGQNVIMFNSVDAFKDPSLDIPLQAGDQIQVARTIF